MHGCCCLRKSPTDQKCSPGRPTRPDADITSEFYNPSAQCLDHQHQQLSPRAPSTALCQFLVLLLHTTRRLQMACTSPVSAAKLFVQLAPARGSQPVLDFLLPRRHVVATASRRALRSSSTAATGVRLIHLGDTSMRAGWRTPAPATALPQRTAPFNSLTAGLPYTPARRYTQAVYNPQKDDEGIEMKLEITPRAAKVSLHPPSPKQPQTACGTPLCFAVTEPNTNPPTRSASQISCSKTTIRTSPYGSRSSLAAATASNISCPS